MMNAKLSKLADELAAAPRQGAAEDTPEGARYVQISDTAIKNIVDVIRAAARDPKAARAAGVPIGVEYLEDETLS
jgi:hypothetical protein